MICIRCKNDSKYSDRKDGKCPSCGGKFAFEPRENDPFTDMAFQKAIDTVSAFGQLKWGVEHLYYELWRKKKNTSRSTAIAVILFLGAFASFVVGINQPVLLLLIIPAVLGIALLAYVTMGNARLDRGDFERMWDRWGLVHGKPKGVIARKPQDAKPARAPEPDLGDYSFDRAVICDRARTVDLLLANNFHFENNCAVLSVGGYPQTAFETVRRMLRRNPRLEVFVLHDITPEGCRLAHQLANSPEWFKGQGIRIVDVGLRPIHAAPFEKLLQEQHREVPSGGGLTSVEARWLSKHALELAVIRPEQVLKRLFRAMNQTNQAARAPAAPLPSRGTPGRLSQGAAGAAVAGAAVLVPAAALAQQREAEELARQKKKEAAAGGGDGGSGSSSSGDGFEIDTDSFSSDADSSDGGADSFG
jgi:DNA-directed RNA polymerase subunit RPC12/RpoP